MAELLTPEARAAIAARKPYSAPTDPFTVGYRTRGGSYVVASNGRQNDRPGIVDLLVVAVDGRVSPLRPTVNPDLVTLVESIVEEAGR